MFDNLSEKLGGILDRLTRRGALSEADVDAALREVRRALLEADVALDVARAFIEQVKKRAVGVEVIKSVTPGQMVVKIVHDELVDDARLRRAADRPQCAGAGRHHDGRPAGLRQNHHHRQARQAPHRARQAQGADGLARHPPPGGDGAARRARPAGQRRRRCRSSTARRRCRSPTARIQAARLGGYDVVLLDTAGRITLDEAMMTEAAEVKRAANPHEVLLVADSLTGQDAVNLARAFDERVGLTGIVLTRVDGDGRGGAALSMRAVTGKPIKLIGTGERMDALEDFDPARIAGRILGMGDIVSLVEKAAATIDGEKAMRAAERMRKGQFDLNDLREQLVGMTKMGGISGLMGMMPGIAKMKNQIAERNLDDNVLKRQIAIIDSMTPGERKHPDILKASRKKRIAAGSGTKVEEINKLLKMHRNMADMMKIDGRRQGARPDGRPRPDDGLGRRHAVAGRDGQARREHAGRSAAAHARHCRRPCPAARAFRVSANSPASAAPARSCRRPADCRRTSSRRNEMNSKHQAHSVIPDGPPARRNGRASKDARPKFRAANAVPEFRGARTLAAALRRTSG